MDEQDVEALNAINITLASVTTLGYKVGGPKVGLMVNVCCAPPAIAISTLTTLDSWGDFFRNGEQRGDLIRATSNTFASYLGVICWPVSIPAAAFGIADQKGAINWNYFNK